MLRFQYDTFVGGFWPFPDLRGQKRGYFDHFTAFWFFSIKKHRPVNQAGVYT